MESRDRRECVPAVARVGDDGGDDDAGLATFLVEEGCELKTR